MKIATTNPELLMGNECKWFDMTVFMVIEWNTVQRVSSNLLLVLYLLSLQQANFATFSFIFENISQRSTFIIFLESDVEMVCQNSLIFLILDSDEFINCRDRCAVGSNGNKTDHLVQAQHNMWVGVTHFYSLHTSSVIIKKKKIVSIK